MNLAGGVFKRSFIPAKMHKSKKWKMTSCWAELTDVLEFGTWNLFVLRRPTCLAYGSITGCSYSFDGWAVFYFCFPSIHHLYRLSFEAGGEAGGYPSNFWVSLSISNHQSIAGLTERQNTIYTNIHTHGCAPALSSQLTLSAGLWVVRGKQGTRRSADMGRTY